jgi:hypothetical protein
VQFQTVLDAFSPHDTVFSFTHASELTESAVGVHAMLAPSVGSITSSTSSSVRKERLKDISEDAEEGATTIKKPAVAAVPESPPRIAPSQASPAHNREESLDELPASALRAKALLTMRNSPDIDITDHDETTSRPKPAKTSNLDTSSRKANDAPPALDLAPMLPPISISPLDKSLPTLPPEDRTSLPDNEQHELDQAAKTAEDPVPLTMEQIKSSPHLSNTESNSISRWSSEVAAYAVKPKKKKLGPRPHVEPPGRPRTSGTSESNVRVRPVANLPTTVKISTDRARVPLSLRPGSQQSSKSVPGKFPTAHSVSNVPPMPPGNHMAPYYRPESRSVIHQTPSITSEISTTATPEKIRLMKALQLRKRNMLAAQRSSVTADINTTNLAEPKLASSSTTPTTMTNGSADNLKAEESSFTSRDEAARRGSLSSDTSSSVTPKAEEAQSEPTTTIVRESTPGQPVPTVMPVQNVEKERVPAQEPIQEAEEEDADDDDRSAVEAGSPIEAYKRLTGSFAPPDLPPAVPPKDQSPAVLEASRSPPPPLSSAASRSRKGLAVPESLRVSTSAEPSDQSDGESFMDELANATVEEAKPVMVARTPVTPVLSAPALRDYQDRVRDVTIQPRSSSFGVLDTPKSAGARSTSALPVWPPVPTEPVPQQPLTKKAVGSGISRRIKALETSSTRDSTSPPREPVRGLPSKKSAFDAFMKRSSFLKAVPNASTDKSPPKKLPEASSLARTPSRQDKPPHDKGVEAPGLFAPAPKGEAVSVTARIIRGHDPAPPSTAPGDLNLHRSPLIVEHESVRPLFSRDGRPLEPPRSPTKQDKGGRFSFSSYRSMTQPRLNAADSSSKLSFTTRAKIPRSMSDNSSLSEDKGKGGSRAHRLMKRVSNLTGRRSAKNLSSSSQVDFHRDEQYGTIEERMEPGDANASYAESLLHVVDIGDVNVQFPDSMLWKRRFMRIDDQGYLIFSPPATDANLRNASRKFHLADFHEPTLPDLEREQMAWSVILDMKDGNSIQCACEGRAAQQQVLQSESTIIFSCYTLL